MNIQKLFLSTAAAVAELVALESDIAIHERRKNSLRLSCLQVGVEREITGNNAFIVLQFIQLCVFDEIFEEIKVDVE